MADFTLDRRSAESMLNAFAVIEAHLETARVVLGTFPAESARLGLTEAVVFWKDRMRALQTEYDALRRTAALVWLDGEQRTVPMEAWETLKTLDDVSASIAWKAGDVLVARGQPRDLFVAVPWHPETMAATYGTLGPSTETVVGIAAVAALALTGLLAFTL